MLETRTFEEVIAEESFQELGNGILRYMNDMELQTLSIMILRSAGFVLHKSLIRSHELTAQFCQIKVLKFLTLREHSLEKGPPAAD